MDYNERLVLEGVLFGVQVVNMTAQTDLEEVALNNIKKKLRKLGNKKKLNLKKLRKDLMEMARLIDCLED